MADRLMRELTAHERAVLHPEVARLAELERDLNAQRDLVRRMLSLLEPAFAAGEAGVRFDAARMSFVRVGAGDALEGGEAEVEVEVELPE